MSGFIWSGSYADTPGDIGPEEWAQMLADAPKPKLRALHCHPRVAEHLHAISVEAKPEFPGAIGSLTGVPVIEHDDMQPGAWELREDGQVVSSGRLRTIEERARELAAELSHMLPEGLRFEWE